MRDNVAAEAAMTAAVATFEKELAKDPLNLSLRRRAASAARATGDLLLLLKRYDDAKRFHELDIVWTSDQLRIAEIVNVQADLSRAHYRSATLAMRRGEQDVAQDNYRRCVAIRRDVVAAQPKNDFAKIALALALMRVGESHEGVGIMAEMRWRFWRNPHVLAESVGVYGLAAASFLAGRTEEALSFTEKLRWWWYRGVALSSLHRLVMQFNWVDLVRLETDPDLDTIRDSATYRNAVETVKKRIAEQKKP
jgi:tetratricopeptide (TPR) repeat protein